VKVLAAAPAVLDLFMWLSYRCFVAKGKEMIPLFGSRGLARSSQPDWLDRIRAATPFPREA
jgi:putative heme degradation protein